MYKFVSPALLVGGILLIVLGINATNSLSSNVSRFYSGTPTDKAVWMLIAGIVGCVVGLVGLMRRTKAALT